MVSPTCCLLADDRVVEHLDDHEHHDHAYDPREPLPRRHQHHERGGGGREQRAEERHHVGEPRESAEQERIGHAHRPEPQRGQRAHHETVQHHAPDVAADDAVELAPDRDGSLHVPWRQAVHRRRDEPRHVPEQEEGKERNEDREQEEVPDLVEEVARIPGGTIRDVPLDPAPALGEHAAEAGRRLDQLAEGAVEARVDLGQQRRQAVRQARRLDDHARPQQHAGGEPHGDDDGEERTDRHAPADREGIRPRDDRAQQVGQHHREEDGQDEAARQPGERGDADDRHEPEWLHGCGSPAFGSGAGSVKTNGLRRVYAASTRERLRRTTRAIRASPSISASKSLL